MGCFLMIMGFFVGNRGPARVKSESAASGTSAVGGLLGVFGDRRIRWATLVEQNEAINNSAFFVLLGPRARRDRAPDRHPPFAALIP